MLAAVKDTVVGDGDGGGLHGDQTSQILEVAIGKARGVIDHVIERDGTHIRPDPVRLE